MRAFEKAAGARVYRVAAGALEELRQRIESLDRRAARLGCEPIRLRDTGERDRNGNALVVLHGRAPALAGWSLAAIVECHAGKVSVRPVSDAGERLAAETLARGWCEHCGLRRRRTRTFVVVHLATGERRQVGSGCLRDFLGGQDPERACRQAERLALAREQLERAQQTSTTQSTGRGEVVVESLAVHAAHVIRADGWVARARAHERGVVASADRARQSLERTPDAPGPDDRALAQAALRWARTLLASKPDATRFEREAVAVAGAEGALGRREQGLVCALIAVYRQRRARSRHLAQPGTRLETTVLVERVTPRRSRRYGTVYRCELIDANVNRLVWWQTGDSPLRAGQVIALVGRVERHTRFGDTPVTVVSHCRTRRAGGRADKETSAVTGSDKATPEEAWHG